jgi:hypothetical protein
MNIVVGGKPCYSPETDTITLPALPFGELPEDTKETLRAYIGHEAIGERGHSTWKPSDYPDAKLRWIINGMNDARIDRIALREWPGSGMAIREQLKKDLAVLKKAAKEGTLHPEDPSVLACVLRYLGENIADRKELSLNPHLATQIKQMGDLLDATDFDGSETHIIEQAKKIHGVLYPPKPPSPPTPPPPSLHKEKQEKQEKEDGSGDIEQVAQDGDEQQDGKPGKSDAKSEKPKPQGREKQRKPEPGEQEEKSPEPTTEKEEGEGDGEPKKQYGEQEQEEMSEKPFDAKDQFGSMESRLEKKLANKLDPAEAGRTDGVFAVPPGSLKRNRPKPATSRMQNNPFTGEDVEIKPSRQLVSQIMRHFRALQAAEDRVILTRQLTGELDSDRFADLHRGSPRLFLSRRRGETQSLAVYISVDLTGSISSEWHGGGLREFVMALNEALGRLEIPTAIVGWSGSGCRHDWRAKYTQPYQTDFEDMRVWDEPWQVAEKRILSTCTGSANADVPAIADGISALAARPESRKLLFFITDGQPMLDYAPHFPVPKTLLGYTMKSLVQRGRRANITTIACGVGLDSGSHKTMDNIFGEDNYAIIKTGAALKAGLGHEFGKALSKIITFSERGMK